MSPDPSVHKEQLEAIKEEKRRRHGGRGTGCLLFAVLLLVGGLGGYFWMERDVLFEDGEFEPGRLRQQWMSPSSGESATGGLESIRERAAGIQERWEDLYSSQTLGVNLDTLRSDLRAKRDAASGALRSRWDSAFEKGEALAEKARTGAAEAPDELRDLLMVLEHLDGLSTGTEKNETTSTQRTAP